MYDYSTATDAKRLIFKSNCKHFGIKIQYICSICILGNNLLVFTLETIHSNQHSPRLVYFHDLLFADGTWSKLLAILVVRVEILCMRYF